MNGPVVAVAGGVAPSLGGGGLELQAERTAEALSRAGAEVFHVEREGVPRAFELLHAFGSEPDVWHALTHWRRNPAPLVVSPVVVAAPGFEERLVRLAARVPLPSLAQRMRAEVVRRADLAVALTEGEARLLRALGARRVEVVPNGVTPVSHDDAADLDALDLPDPYVLLLGTVSARKRQGDTVDALAGASDRVVVAGGFDGSEAERAAFAARVDAAGGTWVGEVAPAVARALVRRARALVHLSTAEGQSLAVIEALAEGTPVVASPLPANRELAARHPGWLELVDGPDQLPGALAALRRDPGPPPAIPTWDDVAARLLALYRELLG
jgi:glycosyltransferase involved in cell wall biosynthesis